MLQQARQKIRESSGETVKTPAIQQGIASKAPHKTIIENQPSIETTDDEEDEEEFFYDDDDDEQIDGKDEEEIKTTSKPKEENKPVILTSNFFLPGKPIPKLEQHHEFENHEPNDLSSDISETNGRQKDNAEDVIDSVPDDAEEEEEEETERIVEKTTKKFVSPPPPPSPPVTTAKATTITTKTTSTTTPKPATLDPSIEYEYYDEYVDEPTTTETKTILKPVIEQEEQTTIHVPQQDEDEEELEKEEEQSTVHSEADEPEVTENTVEKTIKSSNEQIEISVEPIETTSVSSTEPIQSTSASTEGYVVVASVQTSRSISGARFLTFPQVEQEEKRQSLSDTQKDVKKLHKDEDYSSENVSDDSSDANKADDLVKSTEDKSTTVITKAADSTETSQESVVVQSTKNESETRSDVVKSRTHKLSSISEKLAHLHELNEPKPEITTKSVPVVIRKFTPRTTKPPTRKFTITSKKPNFDTDDELASLLPPGFKYRAQSTTPKTETTTEKIDILKKIQFKEIALEDLLPKDYKAPPPTSPSPPSESKNETDENYPKKNEQSDLLSKIKFDDNIAAFLPKDFKLPSTPSTTKAPFRLSTVTEDISKFLPPGFKLPKESDVTTTTTTNRPQYKTTMDDISKFLPPGYKLPKSTTTTTTTEKPETTASENAGNSDEQHSLLNKLSFNTDISSLLPPGFKANSSNDDSAAKAEKTDDKSSSTPSSSSTSGSPGFKLVFPKGIGKRPGVRLTTPRPSYAEGPTPPGITIRKGLPTR